MRVKLEFMVAGVLVLLLIKYVVLGLDKWDGTFHPTRREPPNSPFLKPFLGVFEKADADSFGEM